MKGAFGVSFVILPAVLLWDRALLFCSHPVHSRHFPSTALKTFCSLLCLLALITVTSVCHIWSPGGTEGPEAVSIPYVSIPYVGRGDWFVPLRWGRGWLGLLLVSAVTFSLRDVECFQMPISHVQSGLSHSSPLALWFSWGGNTSVYSKWELLWQGELPALGCLPCLWPGGAF